MRTRPDRTIVAALLAAAVAVAAVLGAAGGHASKPSHSTDSVSWRGLVGGDRPQVALGERMIVVLRAPSLADRLRSAGGRASDAQERLWSREALAAQQRMLLGLVTKGVFITPQIRYTHVINGFSAVLDPSAVSFLERNPQVVGVYRVRSAFPASESTSALRTAARSAGIDRIGGVPLGLDGQGVEIALLDTGVDFQAPYLHGHVLAGIDVAGGRNDARPQSSPTGARESHGTQMAGILVGVGRDGLSGVAPEATVLPIRVGGWQRDASGRWALYSRSDQILAGLERAVDPDGDGDAHDAARVALISLTEPFAAFGDDPLSRAARGAADLDTLVVAPAGNDGRAGPAFGSLSGPGGAPAALTVAAADLRSRVVEARVLVRKGLRVLLDRKVPLLGSVAPTRAMSMPLVSASGSPTTRRLFDRGGMSTVAGRAVLVEAGSSPSTPAAEAARAGAAVVLVADDGLPAGGFGLEEAFGIPVLGVPASLLGAAWSAGKGSLELSVTTARATTNDQAMKVAGFSSWGLSYGGHPKPEVAGPGVAVVTVDPGAAEDGSSRFVAVNGSSAAAAVVAGQAAALVEARPSLDAWGLKSALVGTANPLTGQPVAAQGSGLVDLGRAASVEVVAAPSTLAFGRVTQTPWAGLRTFVLRNVSTRPLRLYLGDDGASHPGLAIELEPARASLAPGETIEVGVHARLVGPISRSVLGGAVTVAPLEGTRLAIPWTVVLGPVPTGLIGTVQLSSTRFKPSDVTPAVLVAQLGEVEQLSGGPSFEPLLHLDIQLRTRRGRNLGLLTRLRDVLPGRYAFGVTGRGPNGKALHSGRYALRLVAFPSAGGKPVVRSVLFALK